MEGDDQEAGDQRVVQPRLQGLLQGQGREAEEQADPRPGVDPDPHDQRAGAAGAARDAGAAGAAAPALTPAPEFALETAAALAPLALLSFAR